MMRPKIFGGLLLCGSLVLSGCATVRSYQVPDYQVQRSSAGMTYFLPMRMMRLTATRTPLRIDDLTRSKTQKEAGLAAATAALSEATDTRDEAAAVIAALDATASAATRATAQQALDLAEAHVRIAQTDKDDAAAALAAVVNAINSLQLGGVVCAYTAKLELLPPQADPDHRFIASPQHSPLRDDSVALSVSPAGLLSTTRAVAVDRTGDIIVEIAGAIAGMPGAGGNLRTLSSPTPCAALPRQFVRVFDPLRGWPDRRRAPNVDSFTLPAVEEVNQALANANLPFRLRPDMRALVARRTSDGPYEPRASEDFDLNPLRGAIYYRSAIPITFAIEQDTPDGWQPVDVALVTLPQAGPITFIPMNSSAFVRTVSDVQFVDGSISSWSTERPSEVLEIVRLPVKLLTAVMSVPAQLISLRVNRDSAEQQLATSQRQQMETAERMRVLQACIQRAEAEHVTSLPCFQAATPPTAAPAN